MTLQDQIDFGRIHDVADQHGGSGMDRAMASMREYLRQKHLVALDRHRLNFALSTIDGALTDIECGLTARGVGAARDGLAFIRSKIEEAIR